MSITFEQPLFLYIYPLILISGFVAYRLHNKNSSDNFLRLRHPLVTSGGIETKEHWVSAFIYIAVTTLLISLALAQPVSKTVIKKDPVSTKDIIFLVDTSVGMSINDYESGDKTLDRITVVKAILTDFINHKGSSRIGLWVYADSAYMLTPITNDKSLLKHSVERVQTALAGRSNNLSNALNTLRLHIEETGQTPAVVILSQGANLFSRIDPQTVATEYLKKEIKLHFIGTGSKNPANNKHSELIFDAINVELLKTLADKTNGRFFWAGKTENLVNSLNQIKQHESYTIESSPVTINTDYYYWPLIVLTVLFSLRFAYQNIRLVI